MIIKNNKKGIKYSSFILLIIQTLCPFYSVIKAEEIKSLENDISEVKTINKTKEINDNQQNNFDKEYYLIGPGDLIELTLYDAPEFSGEYKVLNDGFVQLPIIGLQFFKNLTLEQAKNLIQQKYAEQLLRPELNLEVKVPRPIRVSMIGEIEKPGIYSLTINNSSKLGGASEIKNDGLPTIIDAIQKAGGITQQANLKKLILIRRLPGENGAYKKTQINLLDIVLKGDQNQNLFLFDGDIIKIHKAKEISKYIKRISRTNISPQTISINVVGQVRNPGKMEVMANTPLVQAIYMAGGPLDWKSNKGNVELLRINKNGSATRSKFKIKLDQDISSNLNPPLMNQDIVYVRSSTINRISTGLGAITEPMTPIITSLTLFKLLE